MANAARDLRLTGLRSTDIEPCMHRSSRSVIIFTGLYIEGVLAILEMQFSMSISNFSRLTYSQTCSKDG